jgi:hypothetical protein
MPAGSSPAGSRSAVVTLSGGGAETSTRSSAIALD